MKRLTPEEVRLVAKDLLQEEGKLPVHWLCRALKAEGFAVHSTFCLGAVCAKHSGMYVMDNTIFTHNENHKRKVKQ